IRSHRSRNIRVRLRNTSSRTVSGNVFQSGILSGWRYNSSCSSRRGNFGIGTSLDLHQVDTRLLPYGVLPYPVPNPEDVATPSMPRYRQRESRSVSWLSKRRGPASNQECRNPSDPRRYRDHSGLSIRSSSVAQDGPGSPDRREDAKDSEPHGPRSYEFCVDDLYNFVRPHRALKFGAEVRTPAMQA